MRRFSVATMIPAARPQSLIAIFSLSLVAAIAASPAAGGLIDFESLAVGPLAGDMVVINSDGVDVTFSGAGLQIRQFGGSYPDTKVLSTTTDLQPITVTFGGGQTALFVEFENIINGRYTAEVDVITGTAYDASSGVLDMETNSLTIHHLDGPGIASVVYDDVNDATGYVMDNFNFVIPEPSSLALALVGLVGLAAFGCRRLRR